MKILVNGNYCTEIIKNRMRRENIVDCAEDLLKELKRNPMQWKKLVVILALVLPTTTLNVFAMTEIREVGLAFWEVAKDVGYVVCLLGAAVEGIKCVVSGTVESIGKIVIKYIAFGLMFKFLPTIVERIFSL